jgi:hypothetical protein
VRKGRYFTAVTVTDYCKYYYNHYLAEIEKGNLIKDAQGFKPTGDNAFPPFAKDKDSLFDQ